jgi:glucose-6-phosphate-specific signal transduction histidine kinase
MDKSHKVLSWTPRILVIVAILFVSIFALDSFSPERTLWQNLAAFAMHMIPSFVLVVVLVIAWRWEFTGGVILTVIGLFFSVFLFIKNYHMNHSAPKSLLVVLLISIPFVAAGILFIIHSRKKNSITAE